MLRSSAMSPGRPLGCSSRDADGRRDSRVLNGADSRGKPVGVEPMQADSRSRRRRRRMTITTGGSSLRGPLEARRRESPGVGPSQQFSGAYVVAPSAPARKKNGASVDGPPVRDQRGGVIQLQASQDPSAHEACPEGRRARRRPVDARLVTRRPHVAASTPVTTRGDRLRWVQRDPGIRRTRPGRGDTRHASRSEAGARASRSASFPPRPKTRTDPAAFQPDDPGQTAPRVAWISRRVDPAPAAARGGGRPGTRRLRAAGRGRLVGGAADRRAGCTTTTCGSPQSARATHRHEGPG